MDFAASCSTEFLIKKHNKTWESLLNYFFSVCSLVMLRAYFFFTVIQINLIRFESIKFAFCNKITKLNKRLNSKPASEVLLLSITEWKSNEKFTCDEFFFVYFRNFCKCKSQRFISNGSLFIHIISSVQFTHLLWKWPLWKSILNAIISSDELQFLSVSTKLSIFWRTLGYGQREISFYLSLFTLWYRLQWPILQNIDIKSGARVHFFHISNEFFIRWWIVNIYSMISFHCTHQIHLIYFNKGNKPTTVYPLLQSILYENCANIEMRMDVDQKHFTIKTKMMKNTGKR